MSFFTDILLAHEAEAKLIARTSNPTKQWPGCAFKNLNEVNFIALYCILGGDDDAWVDFEPLVVKKSGLIVSRFPRELIDHLSELEPKEFTEVARRWSNTEELDGWWQPEHLVPVLTELVPLAARAKLENKP